MEQILLTLTETLPFLLCGAIAYGLGYARGRRAAPEPEPAKKPELDEITQVRAGAHLERDKQVGRAEAHGQS